MPKRHPITAARVRDPISEPNLYWAAGFLEGEGTFGCFGAIGALQIGVFQVNREPLERLQRLFGGGIYPVKGMFQWNCNGTLAAGVMMTMWSLLSRRRQIQIEKGLARWKSKPLFRTLLPERTGFCQRGHPWITENIVVRKNGLRTCRPCQNHRRRRASRIGGKTAV